MQQPLIVAEISANHLGSLERALHLIDAAAEAGADAVKFQTWSPDSMVLDREYRIRVGPWEGETLADLYRRCYTPLEWHKTLFAYARSVKLVPFSSVFDLGALRVLEDLDCPIYKIASFEITDIPLIEAVAATGKPMIISTGMASLNEVYKAEMAARHCSDLTFLACVSAYPSQPDNANLARIEALRRLVGSAGLSDHSHGSLLAVMATTMGASVIEKHLTLSREDGGPDAAFSSTPAEFAAMVSAVREAKRAIGRLQWGPVESEYSSLLLRRSMYWAEGVSAGEIPGPGAMRTARPADGISPGEVWRIDGRSLAVDVRPGQPVRMEQFR